MNDVSAIRISTKLKTDGIARDRKLLEKELSRVAKDAEKANITKAITSNDTAIDKTSAKIRKVTDEIKRLSKAQEDAENKEFNYISNNSGFRDVAHAAGLQAEGSLPSTSSEDERALAYSEAYNQYMDEALQKRLHANQEYQESIAKLEELKTSQETLTKEEQTQLNIKEQLNAQLEVQNQLIAEEQAKLNSQISSLDYQKQKLDEKKIKEIESIKNAKDLDTALRSQGKSIQNGLKKLMGFGMALLGVRAAYSGIRKVVNEVLNQNDQLKNTMDGIWSTLGNAFTPIITSLISGFATVLNYALAILNALTGINLLAKSTKKNTGGAAKDANRLASFDSSEVLNKSGGGGASGTNATLLEEIKLNEGILAVLDRIKAMWNGILGIVSNLGKGIQKAWNYAGNGERIMKSLGRMGDSILTMFEDMIGATLEWSESLDFIPLFSSLAPFMEKLATLFGSLTKVLSGLYKQIILPLTSWVIESVLPVFFDALAGALEILNNVITILAPVWDWFYENVLSPMAKWAGGAIIDIFRELSEILKIVGSWFGDNGPLITDFLMRIGEVIQWLWEEVILRYLNYGKDQIFNVINYIKNHINSMLEVIKNVISGAIDIFDGLLLFLNGDFAGAWEKIWGGIAKVFGGIWNGMIDIVQNVVNAIIGAINAVIRALKTISIEIPKWVPIFGGQKWGFDFLNELDPVNLSGAKWNIPALAAGAVMPPNKPFLAMLGDQTTGRNIETPESLLRQIIQEENAGNNPVLNLILQGDTAQIVRFFKIELQKEDERTGITLVEEGI